MNADVLHILADDGTDEMIKLIFGAVFVLIWIVGGLMSATAKKKPKTQNPQKSWDEIFRELSGESQRPQSQQQQQPPPPPPPVRVEPPPRPTPTVRRPTSAPTIRTTVTSGPPSGPAVRKKLRRKQRTEVPVEVVPPPPPEVAGIGSPVLEVATESLAALPGDISKTEIGSGKAKRTSAAGGTVKQLHAALRPENLRSQFILTEILQPPKALRDER